MSKRKKKKLRQRTAAQLRASHLRLFRTLLVTLFVTKLLNNEGLRIDHMVLLTPRYIIWRLYQEMEQV